MSEIKFLNKDQQGRFLKAIAKSKQSMKVRDLLYFTLALRYGLRSSEGRVLEISQVKLDRNSIFIQRLKGSISQFYPLRKDDKTLIEKWVKIRGRMKHKDSKFLFITARTGSLSQALPAKLFERYAKAAGIEGHSCHSCRHSTAVNLLDQGVDLFDIKTWLGHKNISSTLVYLQLGDRKTQQRMSQILQRI
ncbi:Tyrosine recombinase XerC [subsurface metagenome]